MEYDESHHRQVTTCRRRGISWRPTTGCTGSTPCYYMSEVAPCGLRGCKNRPAPFPGRMSYKAPKPGLVSILYLSMRYTVLLFIRAPFYLSSVFIAICSVFWLFWLSYQFLPSDWLERLLWGSIIVERGSSPESPGRRVCMIFLVYCIASLFYYVFVLSPAPTRYNYFSTFICAESAVKPQANKHTLMIEVENNTAARIWMWWTWDGMKQRNWL